MSWDALAWAIKQTLKAPDKLALLMLAYRTNPDTEQADPSIDKMAKDCGMSRSGMKLALQRLVEAGLVQVETRRGEDGINLPNLYRISMGGVGHDVTEGGPPGDRGVGHQVTTRAVKSFSSSSPSAKLNYASWPELPSDQLFGDWLKVRAAKKAPVTQTIVDRIGKQLHLAQAKGWSVEESLEECVYRNWRGFEAEWLPAKEKGQPVRAAQGTTTTHNGSRNDTGSKQGGHSRPAGGAIDRVLANIRNRQTSADDGAGDDWRDDDGGLRP